METSVNKSCIWSGTSLTEILIEFLTFCWSIRVFHGRIEFTFKPKFTSDKFWYRINNNCKTIYNISFIKATKMVFHYFQWHTEIFMALNQRMQNNFSVILILDCKFKMFKARLNLNLSNVSWKNINVGYVVHKDWKRPSSHLRRCKCHLVVKNSISTL